MPERERMSANVITTLATWLPDDLTVEQLDRVLQSAAAATSEAWHEGYAAARATDSVRRMGVAATTKEDD